MMCSFISFLCIRSNGCWRYAASKSCPVSAFIHLAEFSGYIWYSEVPHTSLNVTSKLRRGRAGHDGRTDEGGGATAGAIHPRTAPACRRRASGRDALLRSHRRDSGGARARDLSPLRALVPLGDCSSARARLEQT